MKASSTLDLLLLWLSTMIACEITLEPRGIVENVAEVITFSQQNILPDIHLVCGQWPRVDSDSPSSSFSPVTSILSITSTQKDRNGDYDVDLSDLGFKAKFCWYGFQIWVVVVPGFKYGFLDLACCWCWFHIQVFHLWLLLFLGWHFVF